ncbi:zf-HC2 domain-containing protein [Microbispora sp. RL4-1S]|uniref:Zf-HC2 domain-containing protein n=1 Tax=Microbispora oryzae TaxID=2806554 RepID=A0A940WQ03_9ACTN|nr:zf-HC2 domain-containing protein [Microbispora oryzae]MBP2705006.1 zf-HC2 domain-containing protein [Microbispora oryzae]
MTCDEVRISLGVYVLGALDDEETARVEAHLDGCPDCRAELAELSGLPPLLARVSADEIAHASEPPRAVLDRLLADSVRRRRRSRALLTLAASIVVAALGGTTWLGLAGDGGGQVTSAAAASAAAEGSAQAPQDNVLMAPVTPGADARSKVAPDRQAATAASVRLAIKMTPTKDGTRVAAEVSGVPVGTACTLHAVGVDGTVTEVASWSVDPASYGADGTSTYESSTALRAHQISRFELRDQDGRTLAAVDV